MELKVGRYKSKNGVTLGELWLNGKLFCYTLEDEIRPLLSKIWGKTAIPAGKYNVACTYSNKFQKYMPEVLNVPGFKGVRIHSGNTITDTLGCLLVGDTIEKESLMLLNSKDAFNKLFPIIKEAETKEKITIEYINLNKDFK